MNDYHEIVDARSCDVATRARIRGLSLEPAMEFAEKFVSRVLGGHPGTFGIERITMPSGAELVYLNSGDTYSRTLCSIDGGEIFVSTWGDCVEQDEEEHCEDTGTIQCGWCSHFTPMNKRDWHNVVCESCGHHVDGAE